MTHQLNFAIKTAQKAGKLILKERKKALKIAQKTENDFVTNVDKASEALIIKEISKAYPDHGIFAEESAGNAAEIFSNHEYVWIIDPIDGTRNFMQEIPFYAVSIGLFQTTSVEESKNFEYLSGEIIAGVVFAPKLDELFSAAKGKGAKLNGKKIQCSETKKLKGSITATGFPATKKERNLPYAETVVKKGAGYRRLGSAAIDLAYCAAGRLDGFWEFNLQPWDIAAGSLIVKEAGGTVTDTNGNQLDLFGQDILASNGKIHQQMINAFKNLS